jgi:hypothetical protein
LKFLGFFALTLALAACATPPERYDAFAGGMAEHAAGVAREAERVRLMPLPALPQSRGRAGVAAAPADCRNTAELTPALRERCAVERRMAVTALVSRHAQALAEYAAALAILGTRFDASPAMPALEASGGQAIALGERLQAEIPIDAAFLEPFRPMDGPMGLRPALASEIASNGWQFRRQLEIQAVSLEWLELRRGDEVDEELRRLRWSIAHLRRGFEVLTVSDGETLPHIASAREALGR